MSTQPITSSQSQSKSDDLLAQIAALRAENAALAAAKSASQTITLKVSEKGAVSVYGMGKWPVTLYAEQWEKLLGKSKEISEFIAANRTRLSTKADKAKAAAVTPTGKF